MCVFFWQKLNENPLDLVRQLMSQRNLTCRNVTWGENRQAAPARGQLLWRDADRGLGPTFILLIVVF